MKKVVLGIIVLAMSPFSMAEETTFSGGYLGIEINSVKQDFSIPNEELGFNHDGRLSAKSSNSTGFGILGGYGFEQSDNFVGLLEGKLRINGAKVETAEYGKIVKEYASIGMGYLQGYRITNKVMPYVKVSLESAVLDVSDLPYNSSSVRKESDSIGAVGFGYGAGMKFSLTSDAELGVEWLKTSLYGSNHIRVKNTILSLGGVYKF